VIDMIALSTAAGASVAARAVPGGLEADGVDRAVHLVGAEDLARPGPPAWRPGTTSMVSQPNERAWASRSWFRSPTITTAAPEQLRRVRRGQPDRPAPAT
jgi:hypothetical protein